MLLTNGTTSGQRWIRSDTPFILRLLDSRSGVFSIKRPTCGVVEDVLANMVQRLSVTDYVQAGPVLGTDSHEIGAGLRIIVSLKANAAPVVFLWGAGHNLRSAVLDSYFIGCAGTAALNLLTKSSPKISKVATPPVAASKT